MRSLCCLAIFLAACDSGSKLTLSVTGTPIADGLTPITIIAHATTRGAAVLDGTEVNFNTTLGSFSATEATLTLQVSTSGGVAQAQLYPPKTPDKATFTASFSDPNNESISAELTIAFAAGPAADAASIGFSCDAAAIAARATGVSSVTTNCALLMKTPGGAADAAAEVTFYSEAGTLTDAGPNATGARIATYTVSQGDSLPVDVDPTQQELDFTTASAGVQQNPRDMLATLMAVVTAEEAFTDVNGNGKFDEGEPFVDEAEPFIDVDDDGVYDASIDKFLPAFDLNGNGQWDSGNGVWDASTKVARSTHVLWVGDVHPSVLGGSAINVGAAPGVATFLVVDAFGNPPVGVASGDAITISFSLSTGYTVTGAGVFPVDTSASMSFTPSGVFSDLLPNRRSFDVSISDVRGDKTNTDQGTLTCTLQATSSSGGSAQTQSVPVTVNVAKGS